MRLVVELQSWEHHGHRQAFERDNSKLARLQVAGHTVLPLTDRQLRHEAGWVADSLRAALHGVVAAAEATRSAAPGATL